MMLSNGENAGHIIDYLSDSYVERDAEIITHMARFVSTPLSPGVPECHDYIAVERKSGRSNLEL